MLPWGELLLQLLFATWEPTLEEADLEQLALLSPPTLCQVTDGTTLEGSWAASLRGPWIPVDLIYN